VKITWSVPVPGEPLDSGRGDLVRAARLIAAIRGAGHEVVVVHAASRPGTEAAVSAYRSVVRRLLPRPLALVLRDLGRAAHARAHARRVAWAAREQGADLIIETQVHLSDCGARAARASGLPLLLDDCSPAGEETVLGAGLTALARRMFARQTQAAAALIVSSPALRERLAGEGVSPERIFIVSNGVDVASYQAAARQAARERFRLGPGPMLGFVGSFQPWHQVDLLVEAMARLVHTPPPRLLLAGDGPGLGPTLATARHLGLADRVVALGALPPAEVPLVLAACDVGVLPGTNEYGQPMKLLEYAAAGLATVAPDLPPVRELLADGLDGLLFTPGDADDLARALECLLESNALRQRLGSAARCRIAASANWSERGRELAAVAERVA
jgi:glycosyltransferase involved in cell wall biosynthesis